MKASLPVDGFTERPEPKYSFEQTFGRLLEATAKLFKVEVKTSIFLSLQQNGKAWIAFAILLPVTGLFVLLSIFLMLYRSFSLLTLALLPNLSAVSQQLIAVATLLGFNVLTFYLLWRGVVSGRKNVSSDR